MDDLVDLLVSVHVCGGPERTEFGGPERTVLFARSFGFLAGFGSGVGDTGLMCMRLRRRVLPCAVLIL